MGHTNNSIIIDSNIDNVFYITNEINCWKEIFTEYSVSEVIQRDGNKLVFRLETVPDEDGHYHSWTSERIIDKANYRCTAERLDPKYPFKFMHITWTYEDLGGKTKMNWVQKFEADPQCPWDDKKLENYINKNSKIQMTSIKEKIEEGYLPQKQ